MIKSFRSLVIISLLSSSPVLGDTSTQELFNHCKEENETSFEEGLCIGFIQGVSQHARKELKYVPADATYGQMRRLFVKWAKNNPEQWHKAAAETLIISLNDGFGCDR